MTALVSVRDLAVSFGGTTVVSGVDFDIEAGQCVAVVGESGSGKSVTARALLGLTGGSVSAAEMRFDGTDLRAASPTRLRRLRGREIGFVSQGALVALDPLRPVGREIEDSLRIHTALGAAQRRERAIELLAEAGVPQAAERAAQRPDELSGGLRQRALIASAIALRPRLLIADEPTTALDTTVQAGILDLLESLRDAGTAILLISHDLAVVSRLASHLVVMAEGRVVESGPAERVLAEPRHPYTRRLIAAVPTDRPRFHRLTAAPQVAQPPVDHDVVLCATGLRREFGSRVAVDGVGFVLERGKTLGIVGESGSGKTTVARLVLALDRPDAGEVRLPGRPWSTLTESQRRGHRPGIGAIYQDALSSFDPRLTVGQILADALSDGRSRRATREVVELMASVGLPASLASRRPRLLSGGQQQRVAIARAIAPKPHILVCDEPVSSLDVSVQAQVLDLLDDLQRSLGLSYLLITHDLGVVRHMSDDLLVMQHGRVLEAGPTESVFSRPQHDYTRALLDSAPRIG